MAHRWATEVFCNGPQSILVWKSRICTMSCLLIWFESLQKVAVNGELTGFVFFWDHLFSAGKTVWILVPFFWEITWEITWFWQKIAQGRGKLPPQSNSRLMKIWVKFVYWLFQASKNCVRPLPTCKILASLLLRVEENCNWAILWELCHGKIFKMKMGHG